MSNFSSIMSNDNKLLKKSIGVTNYFYRIIFPTLVESRDSYYYIID